MTPTEAQEAHEEIARLRNERDAARAAIAAAAMRDARMRRALERARAFVQFESQRQSHSILPIKPAVETLAMIDDALADPPPCPERR